jgi:hypothetical protein
MTDLPGAEAAREAMRVTPAFTSIRFDTPAYGQLTRGTAPEIRTGADNGAEMGVWNLLQQPQREANLAAGAGRIPAFRPRSGPDFRQLAPFNIP